MLLEGVMLSVCREYSRENAKKLLLLTKLFGLPISKYTATIGHMAPKSIWTLTLVHHINHEDVPLIFDIQKVFKYFCLTFYK